MDTKTYTQENGYYHYRQSDCLLLQGADVVDLLQRLSTNNCQVLTNGEPVSTVLTTDKGRIVDVICCFPQDNGVLVSCSENNLMPVVQHLRKYIIMDDVRLHDVHQEWQLYFVYIEKTAIANWSKLKKYKYIESPTNNRWFTFVVPMTSITEFEQLLEEEMIYNINIETFHNLRIEHGFGALGTEWSEEFNPLEANLYELINFKKGCYIGQEVIARLDTYNKVQRRLCKCTVAESVVKGSSIISGNTPVGIITSLSSANNGQRTALCYIRAEYCNGDQSLSIDNTHLHIQTVLTKLSKV